MQNPRTPVPAVVGRAVEALEPRRLFAAVPATHLEQYVVELINRARANPEAEAARYGIALNEGVPAGQTISASPKQPLAVNPNLTDAARKHSQWMIDNDVFSHFEGAAGPTERMAAAGYSFVGNWTSAENIAWRGSATTLPNPQTTTAQLHQDLFVDANFAGRGHRLNILAPEFREIGNGVVAGAFLSNGTNFNAVMLTEDFAANTGVAPGDAFLTGVAYDDLVTDDDFYTPGEGLGGVTVTAAPAGAGGGPAFSVQTFPSGGYSLRLPPGAYTVTASGGGLGTSIVRNNLTIAAENVKQDFIPGPANVDSIVINDGHAQRSMVNAITVTFDRPVVLDAGAITVVGRNGAGAGTIVTAANPQANPLAANRTWTVTFSGTPVIGGSLADGVYDLTVVASKVHTDAAAGATMTANAAFEFHRLFSDADADGDSDNADLFQFRAAYGKPPGDPAYRAYFDFENDGDVDNADLLQVRGRRTREFKGY